MSERKIGVIGLIVAGGKLLVGKRGPACKRGAGHLACPGGLVNENESLIDAVVREVKEETDLTVKPVTAKYSFSTPGVIAVTDHLDLAQQRDGAIDYSLSVWIALQYTGGEAKAQEPTKCEKWEWRSLYELRQLPGITNPTHPQHFWLPWSIISNAYWLKGQ